VRLLNKDNSKEKARFAKLGYSPLNLVLQMKSLCPFKLPDVPYPPFLSSFKAAAVAPLGPGVMTRLNIAREDKRTTNERTNKGA
jgi:hypothetical protein